MQPRTELAYVIQGSYGHGWEDETQESTWREAKERLREYRENSPYPVRYIRRRVCVVCGEPKRAHSNGAWCAAVSDLTAN